MGKQEQDTAVADSIIEGGGGVVDMGDERYVSPVVEAVEAGESVVIDNDLPDLSKPFSHPVYEAPAEDA